MHNIIKMLSRENLECFAIPSNILPKIFAIVHAIKNEAFKKYNNGKSKTCFFNHHHYNLLFLKITPLTLRLLEANDKDKSLHSTAFGLTETLTPQDFTTINIVKSYIFAIVKTSILDNIKGANYADCVRLQYV